VSDQVRHRGSTQRFTIKDGAWCRGDQFNDLEVTVTLRPTGTVGHISVSHRSLTLAAIHRLFKLAHPNATVTIE